MKNKDQDNVLEIIAQSVRGEWFVAFPHIDLKHVKTSSLYLLYKAVNKNILYLLGTQEALNEELSSRTKHAERPPVKGAVISFESIYALEKISKEIRRKLDLETKNKLREI